MQLVHNIRVADMNGDGAPDLLIFEQDQSAQQRLMIVYNEGATGQNFLEQTLATTGGHNEWVADANGDGSLDIVNSRHGFYSQINPIEIWMNNLPEANVTPASITAAPVAVTTVSGSPATFEISATGTGPLAYQWQRDGADIDGATSASYTIDSTAATDAGVTFRCIVSNAAGFVASSGALLTLSDVEPPPPVSGDTTPPVATLSSPPPPAPSEGLPYEFTVTYADNIAINTATLGDGNLVVSGPGGYTESAALVSLGLQDSRSASAVYTVPAPTVNGTYTISTGQSGVQDVAANAVIGGTVGSFVVSTVPPVNNGPDLTATLLGKTPQSLLAGASTSLRVKITNSGVATAKGVSRISAFASTDGTLATSEGTIVPTSGGAIKINLKAHASSIATIKFTLPADLSAGSYQLGAWVDSSNVIAENSEANNTVSTPAISVRPPFQSIKAAFSGKLPSKLVPGGAASVAISIANLGNIPIAGKMTLSFSAAADQQFDDGHTLLGVVTIPRVAIKPGTRGIYHVKLRVPAGAAMGPNYLAVIASSGDSGGATDTAVTSTPIQIA